MSLQLRRISLNNFRKFREPLTIEGLDGAMRELSR